ncbi:MAG: hypothetical protein AABZ80_12005 [Gemmatimonadota bacterium]
MTLAELALLAGASPKWVLNAAAVVPVPRRYSLDVARRLAVTRAIQSAAGATLPKAWASAGDALSRYHGEDAPVTLAPHDSDAVVLTVDVGRLLSEVNVRHSQLNSMYAPRQRGRRRRPQDPVRDAVAYGLDVSLMQSNLERTVAQRVRQLDAMIAFRRNVRRGAEA